MATSIPSVIRSENLTVEVVSVGVSSVVESIEAISVVDSQSPEPFPIAVSWVAGSFDIVSILVSWIVGSVGVVFEEVSSVILYSNLTLSSHSDDWLKVQVWSWLYVSLPSPVASEKFEIMRLSLSISDEFERSCSFVICIELPFRTLFRFSSSGKSLLITCSFTFKKA